MLFDRYKDAPPAETISHIDGIIASLGIVPDIRITERVKGIYSATITDKVNGWTTSGKGTTEEYCIASGYGEAVEHLCSYFAYDPSSLSQSAKEYLGFFRYPDEKSIQISDIPSLFPEVFSDMKSAYCQLGRTPESNQNVIDVWESFLSSKTTNIAPYYNVKKDRVDYLPEEIIGKLCGSNGGGAGNTPAEAIGHGLDEICERYAKHEIYKKRLSPPTVPSHFIEENYPFLQSIIDEIHCKYGYKVYVKDASLGKGLPVVAVLIIDQVNHKYLVNFGAHPSFAVAVERCFTELFQVFNPDDLGMKRKDLARWKCHSDNDFDGIRNWVSLLRDDTGIVPHAFFTGSNSWKFEPWSFEANYNNACGVRMQLANLQKLTDDSIYIRDFSFLGFPVYRVYVPGISTTCLSLDEQQLSAFAQGEKLIQCIRSNNEFILHSKELNALLENVFHPDSFISSLIFRNLSNSILNALTAALYLDLGEEEKAYSILANQDDRFCECVVRDYELKHQGVADVVRSGLLEMFYGAKELEFALCWREKNVFASLIVRFFGGNTINLNGNSSNDINQTDQLHKAIKETMLKNIPNQAAIKWAL